MSHEPHMQHLLEELYKIEPDLRAQEASLEKIISQMLLAKPKITVSENFKKVLRNRLDSEIALQRADGVHTKNKYFRILWYIAAAGALASFAVSFGFLSIFKTTPPHDIRPTLAIKTHAPELMEKNPASTGASQEGPLVMNRSIHESDSIPEKGVVGTTNPNTLSPPKKTIPPSRPLASLSATGTASVQPSAMAMSLMATGTGEIAATSSGHSAFIAYVGEDMNIPPSSGESSRKGFAAGMSETAPMGGAAADSAVTPSNSSVSSVSTGSEGATGSSASTSTGITFSEIVSRAQAKADALIPENERDFYVLTTPITTYISRNSKTAKDTVELVPVYVFPLVRTDGKESKVKEVQVIVP